MSEITRDNRLTRYKRLPNKLKDYNDRGRCYFPPREKLSSCSESETQKDQWLCKHSAEVLTVMHISILPDDSSGSEQRRRLDASPFLSSR